MSATPTTTNTHKMVIGASLFDILPPELQKGYVRAERIPNARCRTLPDLLVPRSARRRSSSRNLPCLCGSGRKAKYCCGKSRRVT